MAHLHVSPDIQSTAIDTASFITALSAWDIHYRGHFTIALSGGLTPRLLYQVLAAPPYIGQIEWDKWEVFWSEERSVPPDHPESNYRMAKESLLDFVPIPESKVHRIEGELDPDDAARLYETELKTAFEENNPTFDLVLLGIGPDGHTASLFPKTKAVGVSDRLVTVSQAPSSNSERVTLTLPTINAARTAAFLVSGKEKAKVARDVIEGTGMRDNLPAALVQPDLEAPHVFLDSAAASLLSREAAFEHSEETQNGRAR